MSYMANIVAKSVNFTFERLTAKGIDLVANTVSDYLAGVDGWFFIEELSEDIANDLYWEDGCIYSARDFWDFDELVDFVERFISNSVIDTLVDDGIVRSRKNLAGITIYSPVR